MQWKQVARALQTCIGKASLITAMSLFSSLSSCSLLINQVTRLTSKTTPGNICLRATTNSRYIEFLLLLVLFCFGWRFYILARLTWLRKNEGAVSQAFTVNTIDCRKATGDTHRASSITESAVKSGPAGPPIWLTWRHLKKFYWLFVLYILFLDLSQGTGEGSRIQRLQRLHCNLSTSSWKDQVVERRRRRWRHRRWI